MSASESIHPALFSRLVDALYVEAMVLADEARSYFDSHGQSVREGMDMMTRLSFTCESLKVTTRLMHIIAWLLTQRAWQRGEIDQQAMSDPKYMLGDAAATEADVLASLPEQARQLVSGSEDLYERVRRLQDGMRAQAQATAIPALSLVHSLQAQIEQSF